MKRILANWMIAYGCFLITCGAAGYLSNPQKAATALISGGSFGALSIFWGWLLARNVGWSRWAAATTTSLLGVIFAWRASVSWVAVGGGAGEKVTASVLITLMGTASIAMLLALLLVRRDRTETTI